MTIKAEETRSNAQSKGQQLYRLAKDRIPGGTQLLSKRPEMFLPEQWPSYFSRTRGAEVWDLDGNRYVDMSHNGVGSCVLGAADPEVDEAVRGAIATGTTSTLNAPEEVELAGLLCELHPWAEMARFARTGGECMAVAVRIARAYTRRDRVAFCGYHGWHDWYLSANLGEADSLDGQLLPGLEPIGVPRVLQGTALPFHYNRLEELEAIADRHGKDLAAVVMEPVRDQDPQPDFIAGVHEIVKRTGAVLVVDEISAGFRLTTGGAHLLYGWEPHIATFSKALSNGYPMAAVIGRRDVMQAAQTTFCSSNYWTERIGPVAALATIRKYRRCDVAKHLIHMGQRVQQGWRTAAKAASLKIEVGGIPPLSHFAFVHPQKQAAMTLFTQLMFERGILSGYRFYPTYAHQDEHVDQYVEGAREAFAVVAEALCTDSLMSQLKGPVAHAGFQRLT